jgi:hypothetical protein
MRAIVAADELNDFYSRLTIAIPSAEFKANAFAGSNRERITIADDVFFERRSQLMVHKTVALTFSTSGPINHPPKPNL